MRYGRWCGRISDRRDLPYRSNLLWSYRNSGIPYYTGLFCTVCDHAGGFLCRCICTDLVLLEGIPGGFQDNSTENGEYTDSRKRRGSGWNRKKLYAPIQGTVIARNEIPDETFAAGVLGDGVGIDPKEGVVVAPFDGEISSVTDTKHAIGITGPADMEVLIHVGVDTVNMKGDGFELLVEEGQKVKAGQKLMTFDIEKIKAAGYSPVAAVLLTNSDEYPDFRVVKTGQTRRLEEVFTV